MKERPAARAGDVLEATAELVRVGTRSREVEFTARVLCRAAPERSASAAEVLAEPVVVIRPAVRSSSPDRVRNFSPACRRLTRR